MWLALPVEASKADGAGNREPWIQGTTLRLQTIILKLLVQDGQNFKMS